MSIEDLYTDTVTIKRKAETEDDDGSWSTVLNDLIVDLSCHIWPLTGREQNDFMKRELIADYGLMCAPQVEAVKEKDVVIWNSKEYDIVWVVPQIVKQKYLKLYIQERE